MAALRDRNTPDVIVLTLTVLVAFVIGTCTVLIVIASIWGPGTNVKEVAQHVSDLTGSVLAIIVGYIGGRGAAAINGKSSDNGHATTPEEG